MDRKGRQREKFYKFYTCTGFLLIVAGLLVLITGSPGLARRIPVNLGHFDTAAVGAGSCQGIAYNSSTGELACVDIGTDEVYLLNAEGVLQWQFDILSNGCNYANGIAYNSTTDQYAIVDYNADEVFYFSAADGTYIGQCDIGAIGSTNATGIAYNPATDQYAIVDSTQDKVYIITGDCGKVTEFSTIPLGSDNPSDIAYDPCGQGYIVADLTDREAYITDASGNLVDQFNIWHGIGSNASVKGLVSTACNQCTFVDDSADEVFFADVEGVIKNTFDLATWGSDNPKGLTYNYNPNEIFVLDYTDKVIYVFSYNGSLTRTIAITALVTYPNGIAINNNTGEIAVTDSYTDKVIVIDQTPQVLYSFPLSGYGSTNPQGVGFNAETDEYLIADYDHQMVLITDTVGQLLDQFASHVFSGRYITGIDYLPPAGNYMVSDSYNDEIWVVDSKGFGVMSFDTNSLGITSPQAVAYDRMSGKIGLVDNDKDSLYVFDIPAIRRATSLTGTFKGIAYGIPSELVIRETGQGFLSCRFEYGSKFDFNTPGFFDPVSRKATVNLLGTPLGVLNYTGTVSANLNTITFPAPLGTFNRKLN